jgi:light-regulated signal transduction histidine kinase (bacteriophytochrome)
MMGVSQRKNSLQQIEKFYHDIQGPLRNISSFLQLIKIQLSSHSTEKTEEYIDFAIKNIEILGNLNRSLVSEKYRQISKINFAKIVDDIRHLLKNQIENLNCKIIFDKNIPEIEGVYFDILRVFKNLVENSLNHANTNNLIIRIGLLSKTKTIFKIIFEDNGENLSQGAKIRIKTLLKHEDKAICSGLSICKEIMNKYSGDVNFLEKANGGCAYELVFRIHIGDLNGI